MSPTVQRKCGRTAQGIERDQGTSKILALSGEEAREQKTRGTLAVIVVLL